MRRLKIMNNRIDAKFEKVSFETFSKDYRKHIGQATDGHLHDLYDKIILPTRSTGSSAGYDFTVPHDVLLTQETNAIAVVTGIKCKLPDGYVLQMNIRSSMAIKSKITLANSVGIIDADYYNNESNEGDILLGLRHDLVFKRIPAGTRVAQGIISQYYITEDDDATTIRTGGVGSTGS